MKAASGTKDGTEAAHHVAAHPAHEGQAVIGAEGGAHPALHAEQDGAQPQQHTAGDAGRLPPGEEVQNEAGGQTGGDGKQDDAQQGQVEEGGAPVKGAQQQLVIERGGGEKQDGQQGPAHAPPPGVSGGAGVGTIHQQSLPMAYGRYGGRGAFPTPRGRF